MVFVKPKGNPFPMISRVQGSNPCPSTISVIRAVMICEVYQCNQQLIPAIVVRRRWLSVGENARVLILGIVKSTKLGTI